MRIFRGLRKPVKRTTVKFYNGIKIKEKFNINKRRGNNDGSMMFWPQSDIMKKIFYLEWSQKISALPNR